MLRLTVTALRGARRGVLSSKNANKNYYKGKGARSTGFLTKRGTFRVDPTKRLEFVVPAGLDTCDLKPYVTYQTHAKMVIAPPTADTILQACPLPEERS